MQPKILFTDIDGTLLDKHRELSLRTKEEIARINRGLLVPVILVSARMPKSMRLLQQQLGLTTAMICYNGSLVFGKDAATVLVNEKIDSTVTSRIVEKALSLQLHLGVFVNDEWFVNKLDEWADREVRNTRVTPIFSPDMTPIDFIRGAHKIMIMGEPEKIDKIQEWTIGTVTKDITCYRSKATYLEISSKNANKYCGIKKVLSLYNYTLSDAIAIGDHFNDLEMIQNVGIGVAVNNAPDEIKKIAKFICPSNMDDGVAFTIKHFF